MSLCLESLKKDILEELSQHPNWSHVDIRNYKSDMVKEYKPDYSMWEYHDLLEQLEGIEFDYLGER